MSIQVNHYDSPKENQPASTNNPQQTTLVKTGIRRLLGETPHISRIYCPTCGESYSRITGSASDKKPSDVHDGHEWEARIDYLCLKGHAWQLLIEGAGWKQYVSCLLPVDHEKQLLTI